MPNTNDIGITMYLRNILKEHRWRFAFTLLLILVEVGMALLFPLFIGFAADDAVHGSYQGALQLGILGLAALIVGTGRRVFDSRFYAKVYQKTGTRLIASIEESNSSVKTARLGMIRELVEFLENSLPEIISNIAGLVGVVIIIATINLNVFYGSLGVAFLVLVIYGISSNRTVRLNRSSNDELEKQVDIIARNRNDELALHLRRMMKWNIKLSDLEATNFSFSWIISVGFLVLSIIVAVEDGILQYGALFALIMYSFQYMENIINLPLYYQNWLRLREIQARLEQVEP